ncbi:MULTISPECIES: hypothetical protein [Enterobacterales]|uniref:Uncharacterized protein n=1 Tax=Edwardsiella tarda TaxID=636 RepID=A0A2H5CQA1_EDWTA|nr:MULTISPECIES: hypothetical protein [Enterobacterales]MCU3185871.1 hypothetical protein [Enterobacter hormaechei subsp. steigerwaltii]AUH26727.1 hypothetical protein [Edwardsiella tarda]AWH59753.1 hypothetical protein [Edwardsiella tarda]MCE1284487.1 hypothetical protein [Enterobacter hormaechei]MCE1381914.1 hypothetical protein [Enterobacter hormaechei]
MAIGDNALRNAIAFYMEWISDVSASGQMLPDDEWSAPLFTYLLTKKQLNDLNKLCAENDWPPQTCNGITFFPQTIKHILTSRGGKDGLSWQECAEVLAAALNPRSSVAVEKGHDQQVIVLNSLDVLKVGPTGQKYRGMLIVEVSINDLAPVTAYHASEAKSRAIMRNGR